jgi:cysteinyl-tRNA synthetase
MVTTFEMHDKFTFNCNLDLTNKQEELEQLQEHKETLIKLLYTVEPLLLEKTKLKVTDVVDLIDKRKFINLQDPNLLTYLFLLIEKNQQIKKLEERIEFYSSMVNDVKFIEIYKFIIRECNKEMIDLLFRGWKFFVSGLPFMSINTKRIRTKRERIDWGESNKLRKKLEEEGVPLYDKETGEGVKWFVYFSKPFETFFFWKTSKCRLPNSSDYHFVPSNGDSGNKVRLAKYLKDNPTAYIQFLENDR